jgi:EAL domain-containing protein (putative c-di-GMP-specific phosphodiesterase class I)
VKFSVDDFGKGFSSLSYLRQMPVQALKIDRSFVEHIPARREDVLLIKSIAAMGHALGVGVIAEGAETLEQLHALREAQVDSVQGYVYSVPLVAHEFRERFLAATSTRRASPALDCAR